MRRIRRALLCALLPALAAAAHAAEAPVPAPRQPGGIQHLGKGAEGAPIDITADTVEYDRARDLYVAQGNVRISQPGRQLTADWASFSDKSRQGIASGNVVMVEGGDTLYASFLQFDIDTLKGAVFDGRLEATESHFRMQGAEVRKTGESTYEFEEGTFTSCRCPNPEDRDPWRIRAKQADLEVGGYGTAKNTTVDVLGVPVIWLPYMVYPLKTDRQTGLLLPEFNLSSKSGADIGLPLFVTLGDAANLTVTPHYLTKRGFKPNVDLEYVNGERSKGALSGAFIQDKDIDPKSLSTPFSSNRWFFEGVQDQFLPWDLRAKSDLVAMSDNSYPFDFRDLAQYRNNRFVQSVAFVEGRAGRSGLFGFDAGARTADDLQNPNDIDRDSALLQRLPDVNASALTQPLIEKLPFTGTLGAEYTYFRPWHDPTGKNPTARVVGKNLFLDTGIDGIADARERDSAGVLGTPDGSHDDFGLVANGLENDGRFEEGELLADRGSRLFLTPRIGAPIRLGDALEALPEVGASETLYDSNAQGVVNRFLVTSRLDLRTRFRSRVTLPFGIGTATHLVEPRFGYAFVQSVDQSTNPLYVPATAYPQKRVRQFDLDNVTLDSADRIGRYNGMTFGLGNRFYGKGVKGLVPRLLADANLSLLVDAGDGKVGRFYVEGNGYPGGGFGAKYIFGLDANSGRVEEGLLRVGWSSDQGHDLRLVYRYLRNIPQFFESFTYDRQRFDKFQSTFSSVSQFGLNARLALTRSWALTYDTVYSFETAIWLANRGGVEYLSACRCWAVRTTVQADRQQGVSFNFEYRLLGLGDDTIRPFAATRASRTRAGTLVDAP